MGFLRHLMWGFAAQAPRAEWLRRKGLMVTADEKPHPAETFGPSAIEFIVDLCEGMVPPGRNLVENVCSGAKA